MTPFFEWLQGLPLSTWFAESESIWVFPFVLFLHSLGMGMSAGSAFIVGLRFLGVARPLPVSSLRVLFRIFWAGFFLNLVTGSILFAARATTTGHIAIYYAKLALVFVGVLVTVRIRKFADSDTSDGSIPAGAKVLAAVSLALWLGVIATGRLIAYVK